MTRIVTPLRRIENPAVFALARIIAPFGSAAWAMQQLVTQSPATWFAGLLLFIIGGGMYIGVHSSLVLTHDRFNRGEAATGGVEEGR